MSANPTLAEGVEHPLGGPLALLRRELARVGDGPDGDEVGELGARRAASARRSRSARSTGSAVHHVVVLEVADVALEVLELVGAVDLDHGQLALDDSLLSAMTGRMPGPAAPLVSIE